MATTTAVIGVLSALATTASTAYGMVNRPTTPRVPTPGAPDTTTLSRALRPGVQADAAARLGGGFSPEFEAGVVGSAAGNPNAGLDIWGKIRRAMNLPEAP